MKGLTNLVTLHHRTKADSALKRNLALKFNPNPISGQFSKLALKLNLSKNLWTEVVLKSKNLSGKFHKTKENLKGRAR